VSNDWSIKIYMCGWVSSAAACCCSCSRRRHLCLQRLLQMPPLTPTAHSCRCCWLSAACSCCRCLQLPTATCTYRLHLPCFMLRPCSSFTGSESTAVALNTAHDKIPCVDGCALHGSASRLPFPAPFDSVGRMPIRADMCGQPMRRERLAGGCT
jgi:hypothetical protein